MTSTLVIDASAVITLLIDPTNNGEQIAERIDGRQLHAPDHLPVEVTNVIRRRRHADLLSPTEAGLAVDTFWTLPIRLWPLETLRHRVWDLGANLSSYDGAYVALAERFGTALLTRDARLARAPGVKCEVDLVE